MRKNLALRKVVILTDGATGEPDKADFEKLKRLGVCFHVGLVEGGTDKDLYSFAKSIKNLPSFK